MAKLTIKRPERLVKVCLDGTLVAEYEAVQAELVDARRAHIADKRINGPVPALEKKVAELYKAQEDSTATFKLRGLPRHVWDELKNANPVRKGNDLDEQFGYNVEATLDAAMSADGTIVEVTQGGAVVEFSAKDWVEISPELTDGQWGDFQVALTELNGGRQQVPFSQSGYRLMQDSAAKSK